MIEEFTLIERLRTRASTRRNIQTRKSVQEGKPDRIADLLDEAADEIEALLKLIPEEEIEDYNVAQSDDPNDLSPQEPWAW